MTIFVIWQLRVTLDSISNSCDVFLLRFSQKYSSSFSDFLQLISLIGLLWKRWKPIQHEPLTRSNTFLPQKFGFLICLWKISYLSCGPFKYISSQLILIIRGSSWDWEKTSSFDFSDQTIYRVTLSGTSSRNYQNVWISML